MTALGDLIASGASVDSPYTLDSLYLSRLSQPLNFQKVGVASLKWGDGRMSVKGCAPTRTMCRLGPSRMVDDIGL